MLNDPLPQRRYVWQIDRTRNVGVLDLPASAAGRVEVPLRPMLGRLAVAPAGEEAFGGLWPGSTVPDTGNLNNFVHAGDANTIGRITQ